MAAAPSTEVDPLEFLRANLEEVFDEGRATELFNLYCVAGRSGTHWAAQDVRQLVYDLLTVVSLPCVVPDVTLEAVFATIRVIENPEQRGKVTRDECIQFLLSVTDDAAPPLQRLLQAVGNSFDHSRLGNAVYVLFRPQAPLGDEDMYDRQVFIQFAQAMIPNASDVFVYFVKSGDAIALVCVDGELPPFTNQTIEGTADGDGAVSESVDVVIQDRPYFIEIAPFNAAIDTFPPARRVGGLRSRVARTLADTYVNARIWDQSNYQIVAKTTEAAHRALDRARAFDEEHQISTRVAAKAAELDQTYDISGKMRAAGEKTNEIVSRVAANPNVQAAATKVGGFLTNVAQSITGSIQETEQLVQERRASDVERNAAAAAVAVEAESV